MKQVLETARNSTYPGVESAVSFQTPASRPILAAVLVLCLGAGAGQAADSDSVTPILRQVEDAATFHTAYVEGREIIRTSKGKERTLVFRSWAVNDGDRQLIEFMEPADIRGQKILMTDDGDNIWIHNPETGRTRKLGSFMKRRRLMGTDFTYEDQSMAKLTEKYQGKVVGEAREGGSACQVLELYPTPAGPGYGKIVAWVGKDDHVIRRIDYFEKADDEKPFKRLIAEDVREIPVAGPEEDGGARTIRFPFKMTMTNLTTGSRTVHETIRAEFGIEIPADRFDPEKLGE